MKRTLNQNWIATIQKLNGDLLSKNELNTVRGGDEITQPIPIIK